MHYLCKNAYQISINMETKEIALARVVENKDNPRTITENKFKKLVKSLLTFPRMMTLRPIVVDETMTVLGGNMRLKALSQISTMSKDSLRSVIAEEEKLTSGELDKLVEYWLGWQKNPVATIVNADDLSETQKKEFIIKDNVGFGDWDYDRLANEWKTKDLNDWGMDLWDNAGENDQEEKEDGSDNYERKIVSPTYEPQDEAPLLSKCYDAKKTKELIEAIDNADLDEEVKDFLRVAAYRHVEFNYEKIADYYASAEKNIQRLFEDSALVILDIDSAIEKGFVVLSKDFLEQCGKEKEQQ